AAKRPRPHALESLSRRGPGCRRVDNEDGISLPTIPGRNEKRAEAQIVLPRERRYAQEVEALDCVQRKHAGAGSRRADDVVIGQRTAVIPICIGKGIADRRASGTRRGAVRTLRRQWLDGAGEARLQQEIREVPAGILPQGG